MFKPVHNAVGCITSAIDSVTNVLPLDPDSYGALSATLGATDHTYVRIGIGPLCEVVRVTAVNTGSTVTVDRAQDGTLGMAFAAGATVEYVLAAEAVNDIVSESVPPSDVTILAGDNVSVTENPEGTFTISAVGAAITSTNGTIDVVGTYPNISIDVVRSAFGCCE